ncbi:hypothetical protein [Lysobacter sp. GCM10012299]|uniref:hypothetical protein n=1 Tax=Lysobacter sp. GCM10012299 TaxID=3317333 RepID=UPI003616C77B
MAKEPDTNCACVVVAFTASRKPPTRREQSIIQELFEQSRAKFPGESNRHHMAVARRIVELSSRVLTRRER